MTSYHLIELHSRNPYDFRFPVALYSLHASCQQAHDKDHDLMLCVCPDNSHMAPSHSKIPGQIFALEIAEAQILATPEIQDSASHEMSLRFLPIHPRARLLLHPENAV